MSLQPSSQSRLEHIHNRLTPLRERQEIAEIIQSEHQGIFLRKHNDTIELYCYEAETQTLSDIMSRIDLNDPLNLLGVYSQAMLLSACWMLDTPKRAYIAGFGGGRLGMLLHHCLPDIQIDGSDLDPAILQVSQDYFGVEFDDRYAIARGDSRSDFDSRNGNYDLVLIDIFAGKGDQPDHLTDRPFFEICKFRITSSGVVALNLVEMDPRFEQKLSAFVETFPFCHRWHTTKTHILIGSLLEPDLQTVKQRAQQLSDENGLSFPFASRVEEFENLSGKMRLNE